MFKKWIHMGMALAMAIGVVATSFGAAEARGRNGGGLLAGALVGGLVAGAVIAGSSRRSHASDGCYVGPRRCEWRGRRCWENRYGERVCRGGEYTCWRPRICD